MNTKTATIHATSTSTGAVTFTFPSVTMGQWWNVAATVPTAPATARFTLKLNGSPRFSWAGPQPSAALVAPAGSQISVVGTGLSHSTAYTALLSGGWTTGTPTGVPPAGPSSFALTQITGPVTAEITGPVSITGTVSTDVLNEPTVNLASTTKVIIKQTGTLTVEGVAGGTAIGIAGTVAVSGVAGSINIGTVSGSVAVENVTNGVLAVGDALDPLAQQTFTSGTGVVISINVNTLTKTYSALLITFTGTSPAYCAQALFHVGSTIPSTFPVFSGAFGPKIPTHSQQCIVSFGNEIGNRAQVKIYLSAAGSGTIRVFGLTSCLPQVRADGRTYPMGVFTSGTEYASGASHNIIAAPAVPRRIMLRSLFVSAGAV